MVAFVPSAIRGEDIFRLPHRASATSVSERFVECVNAANLRGLEFNEVPPLLFASSLLKAFILEVEALAGKRIDEAHASHTVAHAEAVIAAPGDQVAERPRTGRARRLTWAVDDPLSADQRGPIN